jgi:hypothetical protein
MDRRERNHKWFTSFDERAMTVDVELSDADGDEMTVTAPVTFEVCETCEGRGRHVNPSIDAHGISREEFDEDPDFRENYFLGTYDVECAECHGRRVSPVLAEHCPADVRARIEEKAQDEANYAAECAAERRMGA